MHLKFLKTLKTFPRWWEILAYVSQMVGNPDFCLAQILAPILPQQ